MATVGNDLESVRELLEQGQNQGWGVAFDLNRHGQWRVSRVVSDQNAELVSDSDFDMACRLALNEMERLANAGDSDPYDNVVVDIGSQQLAAPRPASSGD